MQLTLLRKMFNKELIKPEMVLSLEYVYGSEEEENLTKVHDSLKVTEMHYVPIIDTVIVAGYSETSGEMTAVEAKEIIAIDAVDPVVFAKNSQIELDIFDAPFIRKRGRKPKNSRMVSFG